jgi:hypothetical protein
VDCFGSLIYCKRLVVSVVILPYMIMKFRRIYCFSALIYCERLVVRVPVAILPIDISVHEHLV